MEEFYNHSHPQKGPGDDPSNPAEMVVKLSKEEETDPIKVNAGVKQGCPISPILFNLTTELLISTVQSRCNENCL